MQGIKIPVSLEVLQSSVEDLRKTLANLKPGTTGFKELQTIIATITKNMDELQAQTSKPIMNQKSLQQTENTVGKIEDAFAKAQMAMSRIKFSDLKLDKNQIAEFDALQAKVEQIKNSVKNAKASIKDSLMSDTEVGGLIKQFDPVAETQSFDQLVKTIQAKTKQVTEEYKRAQEEVDKASEEVNKGVQAKDLLAKINPIDSAFLKANGTFKNNGASQYADYLKQTFSLKESDVAEIRDKTAKEVQALLADSNSTIHQALQKISNAGEAKRILTEKNLTNTNNQLQQLNTINEAVAKSQEQIRAVEESAGPSLRAATKDVNDFTERVAESARQMPSMGNAASSAIKGISNLRVTLQGATTEIIRYENQMRTFNSLKFSVMNFMGFTQVLQLVKNGVKDALNHIKELDAVMNRISIVTDMTTGDLWNQVDAYSKMASNYGVSIKGAYEVSQIYYQQGLETADVLTLTNETLKLAKISGLDYAATTDYMTTALRGFKMEMSEASTVVDVYSALAAHTAVSQEELAVAMSKTASSMESVGSTFQETSAMIATMVAVTRESATNIGSAMKSIASRYGELTKDPTKLVDADGEALAFNKVDTALQSVGISMRTVDGQFRDFTDVIIELGEKWNQLDSTQQRYIATQFAGNRQQSRFLAEVSNIDLLKSNLSVAQTSEDIGTIQAYKALDSIETKLEQVKVAYQQFYTTIGVQDIWKGALDGISTYITNLNNLPKLFNKIPLGAIAMIANLISILKSAGSHLIAWIASAWKNLIPDDTGATVAKNFVNSFTEQGEAGASAAEQVGKAIGDALVKGMAESAAQSGEVTDLALKGIANKTTENKVEAAKTASTPSTPITAAELTTQMANNGVTDQLSQGFSQIDLSNLETAKGQIAVIFGEIANSSKEATAAFSAAGNEAVSQYISGILQQQGQAKEAADSIANSVATSFSTVQQNLNILNNSDVSTKIQQDFNKAFEGKTIDFDHLTEETNNAILNIISTVINSSSQLKEAFTAIGKDAGAGYIQGIYSMLGASASAAASLGKTSEAALRASINSNSPSKATMEVGNDFTEGFVIGTLEKAGEAAKSGNAIGQAGFEGLEQSLSEGEFDNLKNQMLQYYKDVFNPNSENFYRKKELDEAQGIFNIGKRSKIKAEAEKEFADVQKRMSSMTLDNYTSDEFADFVQLFQARDQSAKFAEAMRVASASGALKGAYHYKDLGRSEFLAGTAAPEDITLIKQLMDDPVALERMRGNLSTISKNEQNKNQRSHFFSRGEKNGFGLTPKEFEDYEKIAKEHPEQLDYYIERGIGRHRPGATQQDYFRRIAGQPLYGDAYWKPLSMPSAKERMEQAKARLDEDAAYTSTAAYQQGLAFQQAKAAEYRNMPGLTTNAYNEVNNRSNLGHGLYTHLSYTGHETSNEQDFKGLEAWYEAIDTEKNPDVREYLRDSLYNAAAGRLQLPAKDLSKYSPKVVQEAGKVFQKFGGRQPNIERTLQHWGSTGLLGRTREPFFDQFHGRTPEEEVIYQYGNTPEIQAVLGRPLTDESRRAYEKQLADAQRELEQEEGKKADQQVEVTKAAEEEAARRTAEEEAAKKAAEEEAARKAAEEKAAKKAAEEEAARKAAEEAKIRDEEDRAWKEHDRQTSNLKGINDIGRAWKIVDNERKDEEEVEKKNTEQEILSWKADRNTLDDNNFQARKRYYERQGEKLDNQGYSSREKQAIEKSIARHAKKIQSEEEQSIENENILAEQEQQVLPLENVESTVKVKAEADTSSADESREKIQETVDKKPVEAKVESKVSNEKKSGSNLPANLEERAAALRQKSPILSDNELRQTWEREKNASRSSNDWIPPSSNFPKNSGNGNYERPEQVLLGNLEEQYPIMMGVKPYNQTNSTESITIPVQAKLDEGSVQEAKDQAQNDLDETKLEAPIEEPSTEISSIEKKIAALERLAEARKKEKLAQIEGSKEEKQIAKEEKKQALDEVEKLGYNRSINSNQIHKEIEKLKATSTDVKPSTTETAPVVQETKPAESQRSETPDLEGAAASAAEAAEAEKGLAEAKQEVAQSSSSETGAIQNNTNASKENADAEKQAAEEAKKRAAAEQQAAEEAQKRAEAEKQAAEEAKEAEAHKKSVGNWVKATGQLVSGLSGLIDKTDEIGVHISDAMTAVGGTVNLVGAIISKAGPLAYVTAAITAITGLVSFIKNFSLDARIERATKQAETLTRTAKQEKSNTNLLKHSIDELDELKAKRHESAEAAEAYQSKVDDLTEKFPQLITSFDEAGNAIIETSDMENLLAESRKKTADATYEAAKKEKELSELELEKAKNTIKSTTEAIDAGSMYANQRESTFDLAQTAAISKAFGFGKDIPTPTGLYKWLKGSSSNVDARLQGFITDNANQFEGLDLALSTAISNNLNGLKFEGVSDKDLEPLQQSIKSYEYAGIENQVFDYEKFLQIMENQPLPDNALAGYYSELIQLSKLAIQYTSPDFDEYGQNLVQQVNDFKSLVRDPNATIDQISNTFETLKENLKTVATNESDINKEYAQNILADLEGVGSAISTYYQQLALDTANASKLINAYIIKENGTLDAFSSNTGLAGIATSRIKNLWQNNDIYKRLTFDDFKKRAAAEIQEIIDATNTFYNSLEGKYFDTGESYQDAFARMVSDSEHYTTDDIIKELQLGENDPFIEILKNAYGDTAEKIQTNVSKNIQTKIDGRKNKSKTLPQFKIYIDELDNELSKIDSQYYNMIASQLDSLERNGWDSQAQTVYNATTEMDKVLAQLNEAERNAIMDSLVENGITTTEDIDKTRTLVQAQYNNSTISEEIKKQIDAALDTYQNGIITNIALSMDALTSNFSEDWGDKSKNIKKLRSGIDFTEVQSIIDEAASFGQEDFKLDYSDFIQSGDSLVLTQKKATEYWNAFIAYNRSLGEKYSTDLENAQEYLLDSEGKLSKDKWSDAYLEGMSNVSDTLMDSLSTILGAEFSNFLAKDATGELLTNSFGRHYLDKNKIGELREAVAKAYEKDVEKLAQYQWMLDAAEKQIQKEAQWDKGDYTSLANGVSFKIGTSAAQILDRLTQVADGEAMTTNEKADADFKAAVDHLKSKWEEQVNDYSSRANALASLIDDLDNISIGQKVTGELKDILNATGHLNPDGTVKSVKNMQAAYLKIYELMDTKAHATYAQLNDAYAAYLTSADKSNTDLIDTLSSGGEGLDYKAMGELLATYGKRLEDALEDSINYGIERTQFGKIRITNWDSFATKIFGEDFKTLGIDQTPEYRKAYDSYVNSLVELQNQPIELTNQVAEQIKDLTEAKPGQAVNISYLESILSDSTKELLKKYGSTVSQGVLTLGQGLKIPELMQSILKDAADAGVILEDQLVELIDTIEEMLSNMTSLITSGIEGSLSNTDAFNLQTWAKERGYIEQLDFTKTAEGLKLSADSALDLYNIVKGIDSIQGNIVFDKLQETWKISKDEFKTATRQAAYLSSFQPDVFSTFKSLRGNVNMYSRPNIDIGNGEYSTIQGTGYDVRLTRRNGDTFGVRLLMTPIPEWADDAEDILSNKAMGEYVDALVDQNPISIEELIELDAKGIDINGEHYSNLLIDVKDASEVTREEFDKQAKTLHELSDAWEQYYNTLSDAEKAQYDIAKQMALTSATSEDASFNFMNNAIPAGQNNPLNYYSSWGKAWKTLKDSFSSSTDTGMIDYQDFYNIMTEMGNIAAMSGQAIQIGTDTFITDAESAAAAITKGSQMLKVASDGSIKVDLSGFGIDFASGADSMAANVDAGIQAMAESQINMLDGLIQMLETIVAMEQLGDIEGENGVIDFSDLFKVKEWDASSKQWNAEFSEGYDNFRNYVLERIDEKNEKLYNEDLAKGINNTKFKINGQKFIFGDLLKLDASKLAEKADGALGEAYAAMLQAYKKAALSGDYSEDSVFTSLKEILAGTGLKGEIQIGDMTLTLAYNTVLEKGKDGKYHIGNREFTEAKDAAQYQNEKEIADFIGATKTTYDQKDGSIQVEQSLVTDINYNADTGVYTVTFSDGGFSATSSTKEGIKAAIGAYAKLTGETINGDTSNSDPVTFIFQQGATVITEVQIQNGEVKLVNTNSSRSADAVDIQSATQQWINEQTANQTIGSTTVKANQNVNLDLSSSTITPTGVPSEIEITDPLSLNFSKVAADLAQNASSIGRYISASIASGINAGQQPIHNAIGSIETHIRELGNAANDIFKNLQALLRGLQQHISITGELSFETPFGTISGKSGFRSENGKVVINLVGEEEIQEVKDEASKEVTMPIKADTAEAESAVSKLVGTIQTPTTKPVVLSGDIETLQSQIANASFNAHVNLIPSGGFGKGSDATGNIGLAKAKGTLMGELGPELVVSNGRYFVAGQNGAEMVNLADDAIVFNHLQTEQLLKHGMSSGRGKAVTSEKNAVAFATGNTGPAMASASAALAALKNIRAMWEALSGASVSDLAGAGGGGGGGGGDKAVDPSIWIDTVERWYNLMQKIAKLEKEITHEETLRSKLESDWNANGSHYYASQKRSLEALRDQIDAQEQLNLSRQAYYDQRVEALEKSPFGKLIRFDDEGQMFFQEGAMEWLTNLAGFDSEGKANYTDEEKYDILMKAGYGDYMKYDSNGGEIKKDSDGDGEATEEELQTFYGNATKAFWDRIDDYKETTQSLWDSIKEGEDSLLDLQANQNSLLEEIRENQMEVEDEVLKAVEDLRQREIDALQDERDKLEESTQKYIDGLTDALNREQEMYQNQEDETSLNQQRRRLAILQRSGGSAEDIANLRSEIDSSERERYFNLQQQQIDAIQAASDLEIERMDSQIEIMTETLEYQKEYGLLWGNVYAVMQESADKIVSFITNGNSEFWASSELASQKAINEQLFAAEQWTSYRDDLAAAKDSIGENGITAKDISENVQLMATMTSEQMKDNDYRTFDEAMKKEFGNDYDKNGAYKDIFYSEYQEHGDLTKVTASARKKYSDDKKAAEAAKKAAETTAAQSSSSSGGGDGGSGGSGSSSNKSSGTTVYEYRRAEYKTQAAAVSAKAQDYNTQLALSRTPGIPPAAAASLQKAAADTKKTPIITKKKAGGGYVNHGVYELGELGTETVLTASQTKVLRDNILSNRPNSLISLLRSYNENYDGINSSLTGITPVEDNSVTIERVEMTMEVKQIANDYDAKRAGEQALNEMMRIARKTGATNSIRR